jgi:hypothetical protein
MTLGSRFRGRLCLAGDFNSRFNELRTVTQSIMILDSISEPYTTGKKSEKCICSRTDIDSWRKIFEYNRWIGLRIGSQTIICPVCKGGISYPNRSCRYYRLRKSGNIRRYVFWSFVHVYPPFKNCYWGEKPLPILQRATPHGAIWG